VLLVEDEVLISLDAEELLRRLGVEVIRTCRTVKEAMQAIDHRIPDFALLDVKLGGETSLPVAEQLHALGVRFAVITGYSGEAAFDGRFGQIPVISKPYTLKMLREGISHFGRGAETMSGRRQS
jgi:two-component SAPR family response regulator